MHEVLVNRLGGLSLPRKSVVRLTDRPNMTLDVYRGCKTTTQRQQQQPPSPERVNSQRKEFAPLGETLCQRATSFREASRNLYKLIKYKFQKKRGRVFLSIGAFIRVNIVCAEVYMLFLNILYLGFTTMGLALAS